MRNLRIKWGVQEIGLDVNGRRGDFVLISSGSSITILHGSALLENSERLRVAGALCMHDRGIRSVRYLRVSEPVQLRLDEIVRQLGGEIVDVENGNENGEEWRGTIDTSGTDDIPF